MNAACHEDEDRDDLMEGLLAPRKGWPRYPMPSTAAKGKEASSRGSEAAAAAGKAQKGDPEAQGLFVSAFALALAAELGFAAVLQPSQGVPRSASNGSCTAACNCCSPLYASARSSCWSPHILAPLLCCILVHGAVSPCTASIVDL